MNWKRRKKKQAARNEWKAKIEKGNTLMWKLIESFLPLFEFDPQDEREFKQGFYADRAGYRIGRAHFKKRRVR